IEKCLIGARVAFNDELLLIYSIEPLRLHDEALGKTIVKDAEAGTYHRFGRSILLAAHAPGKADARRPVTVVIDSVLRLKAQAVTERHVAVQLPVIFRIEAGVNEGVFNQRVPVYDRQLPRRSALKSSQRIERKSPVKALRGGAGVGGG